MKDERINYGAVDKHLPGKQMSVQMVINICENNLDHTPSASVSYNRQAIRQNTGKSNCITLKTKFLISTDKIVTIFKAINNGACAIIL